MQSTGGLCLLFPFGETRLALGSRCRRLVYEHTLFHPNGGEQRSRQLPLQVSPRMDSPTDGDGSATRCILALWESTTCGRNLPRTSPSPTSDGQHAGQGTLRFRPELDIERGTTACSHRWFPAWIFFYIPARGGSRHFIFLMFWMTILGLVSFWGVWLCVWMCRGSCTASFCLFLGFKVCGIVWEHGKGGKGLIKRKKEGGREKKRKKKGVRIGVGISLDGSFGEASYSTCTFSVHIRHPFHSY